MRNSLKASSFIFLANSINMLLPSESFCSRIASNWTLGELASKSIISFIDLEFRSQELGSNSCLINLGNHKLKSEWLSRSWNKSCLDLAKSSYSGPVFIKSVKMVSWLLSVVVPVAKIYFKIHIIDGVKFGMFIWSLCWRK